MAVRIQSRPPRPAPRALDGRQRRSERSRGAIVQALFELTRAGELEPTAQQVAARARVGIRSVFRHFADMDSLYAELGAQGRASVMPRRRVGRAAAPWAGVAPAASRPPPPPRGRRPPPAGARSSCSASMRG